MNKVPTLAKLFFLVSLSGVFAYVVLMFYTFHIAYTNLAQELSIKYRGGIKNLPTAQVIAPDAPLKFVVNTDADFKYILLWTTTPNNFRIKWEIAEDGLTTFLKYNCACTNCFLTTSKDLLDQDYRNYDAVVIDVSTVKRWKDDHLPRKRIHQQKYIFHSTQSAGDLPVCDAEADDYFNWTWTYKLSSDFFRPFFEVRDLSGHVVAPAAKAQWLSNMTYLTHANTTRMSKKRRALAWIIHKCGTRQSREQFTKELQFAMSSSNLKFDIFGCGHAKCPKEGCSKAIEIGYYFYLVYEDSFAEDYLTDEILKAYNNWAVPIVISGADLKKFLPPNSYIDARLTTPDKLAAIIDYTLRETHIYYGYHRWRNHYTFHQVSDPLRGICEICRDLNDPAKFKTESSYRDFRKWWYPDFEKRCLPKPTDTYDVRPYANNTRHLRRTSTPAFDTKLIRQSIRQQWV